MNKQANNLSKFLVLSNTITFSYPDHFTLFFGKILCIPQYG